MLVDANLLLYASDRSSRFHAKSREWLENVLNGDRRVGLPWESLTAYVRIATHPRASAHPLAPEEAWRNVERWLDVEVVWTPTPTDRHAGVLGALLEKHGAAGALVSDAHLAALALQHGLTVCSADSDFAHFTEVTWLNPLA